MRHFIFMSQDKTLFSVVAEDDETPVGIYHPQADEVVGVVEDVAQSDQAVPHFFTKGFDKILVLDEERIDRTWTIINALV